MDVVLIPAYEPDSVLIELTKELKEKSFTVVVVDDGSGADYQDIFNAVTPYACVVTHEVNKGKGAALKTGMRYILDSMPNFQSVITCDADGQHMVKDVVRVQESLQKGNKFVLTVRSTKKKIPLRSKVGNNLSRFVYALLTNRYLSDNQSGLRGFDKSHVDWLIRVENDNYDYEMNVLYYAAKKNITITTLPIEAIYIANNSSSHFNPVVDTLRIYKHLFKLARASFIALFVAEILVFVFSFLFGYQNLHFTIPSVGAAAYLIQAGLNRYVFFKHTSCYDYWNILVYTIVCYFFYTMACALCMYSMPGIPLWLSFNITYVLCLTLRYYLSKSFFIASRRVDK